ncbi:MAG: [CysO sulfur-carrier protein]-S-L-cysteine hydrolase [Halanaerobiales bacterium]|nr:[CysO sulfur-carrier protein]-S-L-cysteine hydrolase [Halanaerobiales bacterium]
MNKLIIKGEDYRAVVDYCLKEKPNEACGIMAGKREEEGGRVTRVYLMKNTKASPKEYLMEPEEQFAVFKDMRQKGLELISIFHSHPHSPARPSAKDIAMAHYKEAIYTIISLEKAKEVMRAFLISDDKYREIGLKIEE